MNEELDSQISAMFDGELPASECELLARRLSRDEQLQARWGRYAVIGATLRAEGGVKLDAEVARRVSAAIAKEPNFAIAAPVRGAARSPSRWLRPLAGIAVAASVATLAILWLRTQADGSATVLAQSAVPVATSTGALIAAMATAAPPAGDTGEPDSYVVPKTGGPRTIMPGTQWANYVVAHSEFSSPVTRRNLLSALMAESGAAGAAPGSEEVLENADDDAKNLQ